MFQVKGLFVVVQFILGLDAGVPLKCDDSLISSKICTPASNEGVRVETGIKFAGAAKRFGKSSVLPYSEETKGDASGTEYGFQCFQAASTVFPEIDQNCKCVNFSEDCLYLNVYAPSDLEEGEKVDVLFVIHGGAFTTGGASFALNEPRSLVKRHRKVVVQSNYRLNVFGFNVPETDSYREQDAWDNIGVRDMFTALEWVQENIERFGGNPNSVTIMGESAGGTAVLALLAAQRDEGEVDKRKLIHGAVSQSAPIRMVGASKIEAEGRLQIIHRKAVESGLCESCLLVCSPQEVIACMRRMPAETLKEMYDSSVSDLLVLGEDILAHGLAFAYMYSPAHDTSMFPVPIYDMLAEGEGEYEILDVPTVMTFLDYEFGFGVATISSLIDNIQLVRNFLSAESEALEEVCQAVIQNFGVIYGVVCEMLKGVAGHRAGVHAVLAELLHIGPPGFFEKLAMSVDYLATYSAFENETGWYEVPFVRMAGDTSFSCAIANAAVAISGRAARQTPVYLGNYTANVDCSDWPRPALDGSTPCPGTGTNSENYCANSMACHGDDVHTMLGNLESTVCNKNHCGSRDGSSDLSSRLQKYFLDLSSNRNREGTCAHAETWPQLLSENPQLMRIGFTEEETYVDTISPLCNYHAYPAP